MNHLSTDVTKVLFQRFTTLYGEKFTKNFNTPDLMNMWWHDWAEGLAGIGGLQIKEALLHCRNNLEWPPSLAEFRRICEMAGGVPDVQEAFRALVRKDFAHPLVQIAWMRIDTWKLQRKEDEAKKEFEKIYNAILAEFRKDPQKVMDELEQKKQLALDAPVQIEIKNPTDAEIKQFNKNHKDWTIKSAQQPRIVDEHHPAWEKAEINPLHRRFNPAKLRERIDYLTSLDEQQASTLSVDDWYDRGRYLTKKMSDARQAKYEEMYKPPEVKSNREGKVIHGNFKGWNRE